MLTAWNAWQTGHFWLEQFWINETIFVSLLFFMHWRLPGCFETRGHLIRDKRMVLADKNITTLKLNVGIAFQIKKSDIQCKSKPAYLYFFQFLHLDNFIQVMDIHKRMGNIESFNTLIFFFSWLLCLFGETKYLCSFQNLKKL